MNSITKNSIRWTYSVAVFLAIIGLQPQKATAATLSNGWNYAIDSFNDGVTGPQIGGGEFEFYGIAVKETSDTAFIAINSNLSLAGYADSAAQSGNINYGDLFFNFSGQNFDTANANRSLFAVRFAEGNDSGVATTGVYSNVTAKNVTKTNSGFINLNQYNTTVASGGGTPSMGDLAATDPYFQQTGNWTVLNSIASGTKVAEISSLTPATLSAMGLDFSQFNAVGSQTIGFSFNKSAIPSGSYVANLFAECANDAIAIKGEFEAVPEPSTWFGTLAGLSFLGMGAAKGKMKRKIASGDRRILKNRQDVGSTKTTFSGGAGILRILRNRQDAGSTKTTFSGGMGILPVPKNLIAR
ncbi:MAG: PEP-CTERM sorting domain-containing protein [Microcoleus sp. PH2017_22_RUC_O_B]|uniref:XDD3 family exosortase-dependent surface protein n=1 Tax=unclassified Microcoleus TaxID=2642155 RepID=UPI001DE8E1F8|nr:MULTISPECIES: XDD3 family exosortase-dependent surface protein [unclassified Microcoleus]MCC3531137.1 PEP-CTERM sorting domain-containing protein [Microcoleus sp. PH2017_21_RUC_O_A]MCC3541844.1 PEP-CTERM sorting domain-containing protein [Microcoleus sp. PH2017_22_RUC_O_B]